MKILIIDDDTEIRHLLRQLFETHGYEVSEAENGEKGLRTAEKMGPDVVVTDIVMPDREGVSTIMELRKKKSGCKIIAISGGKRNSPEYLNLARKLGADKTMEKPLDLAVLLQTVKELAAL